MQPQNKKHTIEYVPDPNKFDLMTHQWNGQGQLIRKNTYRGLIVEGRQYFERPVNSGNLWFENNKPAGRVEYRRDEEGRIIGKDFSFDAKHIDYVAPLTGADAMHAELEQERAKSAALEKELAAIRADAPKAAPSVVEKPAEVKNHAPTLTKRS